MSAATYDVAIARVFADEGGYTNHPKDPGGPTNWGITIFDARKYWKPDATAEDVRLMPKSVAADIYRQRYAAPICYDQLPAGYDYSLLDAGINSGLGRVVPWSAKALGQPAKTIADVVSLAQAAPDKVKLIQKFWNVRLSFLRSLKTWGTFGKGWGRRVANGEAAAVKMWLQFGAALAPAAVAAKMQAESGKASAKSKAQATTAATTSGGSTAAAAPQIDVAHLSTLDWVLIGGAAIAVIALTAWLINRAIINKRRADAYAAA